RPAEGNCEVVVIADATLEKIIEKFRDTRYRNRIAVFHFAGHANDYAIQLETKFRESHPLYASGFAEYLSTKKNLQLIFLNACSTFDQAELFIQQGIPNAIVTETEVGDITAVEVAIQFYTSLYAGNTIEEAYQEAVFLIGEQKALKTRSLGSDAPPPSRREHPWRYLSDQSRKEAGTWSIGKALNEPLYGIPDLPTKPLPHQPFPGPDSYDSNWANVFWGREEEIRTVYQKLTAVNGSRLLLVYGASGVGKSSLLLAGVLPRLEGAKCFRLEEGKMGADWLTQKKELGANWTYLVVDGLRQVDRDLVADLLQLMELHPNRKIVLSMRTAYRPQWEAALSNQPYDSYYLPPITWRGMATFLEQLGHNYSVDIEEHLVDRMAGVLLRDGSAPVTPFFQMGLQRLFQQAKAQDNTRPQLCWEQYLELCKTKWCPQFLIQQIEQANPAAAASGLTINLLYDCVVLYQKKDFITETQLKDKYPALQSEWEQFKEQLIVHRLLSEPATNQLDDTQRLRIAHQQLVLPLIDLASQSNRPGQVVKQLLQQL
ncbi:MAG: CHAT domain-containing protein, partial [Bacteroidota bacterium]